MKIRVFHSFPSWQLSGVNSWSINLARAMNEDHVFENVMLITGVPPAPIDELDDLHIPYLHLNVPTPRKRSNEWTALKSFLETAAPCIYIPNYDFHRSCSVGNIAPDVKVCAVVHSDEGCYYDEIKRLGASFNSIVAVSSCLEHNLRQKFPRLGDRLTWIPHGVPCLSGQREQPTSRMPIRIFYCNRLSQYQKRIFDLPSVCLELKRSGIDFHLTVAGSGPDEDELKSRFENLDLLSCVSIVGRLSAEDVNQTFKKSDIFLLTSDFEGLPISLLESLAAGCVPVVYDIDSGVRDAVDHGVNGFLVPHGNTIALSQAIARLAEDKDLLASLSAECIRRHHARFSLTGMGSAYRSLFCNVIADDMKPPRRDGRVHVPYDLTMRHRIWTKILHKTQGLFS